MKGGLPTVLVGDEIRKSPLLASILRTLAERPTTPDRVYEGPLEYVDESRPPRRRRK